MKSCMQCDRIILGRDFKKQSPLAILVSLPFIYLPIFIIPLSLLSAGMVWVHLRLLGAKNLKTLRDFLPDPATHRYQFKTQIVRSGGIRAAVWTRTRLFWYFNCTMYCPFSVAVYEWHAYLVKAVENWWCPFYHNRKENYQIGSIDASYWHTVGEQEKLDVNDRENPIWNASGQQATNVKKDHSSR
jgi:hypothetical protein